MKVLIDTNIILDVLCNRHDFLEDSAKVFKLCEVRKISGYVSALSIPYIIYIMRKELNGKQIKDILEKLSLIFSITDLRADDLKKAVDTDFRITRTLSKVPAHSELRQITSSQGISEILPVVKCLR